MVGFDHYLMQIKDQLTRQSSALQVISIVGMGGIGKTTLATNVYNDPNVVDHFDVRDWATMSPSRRDVLKRFFPDDKTGSRILLTTRIADVAAYASPSRPCHQISRLSDDQSWKLLRDKVFGDEPCPLSLEEVGKTIARNCLGFPLSIVVIGGLLLNTEKTRMAWQSIAENVTSLSACQCSHILSLSYNYLPQYLKSCFLFMGVFPRNCEIRVSKLTKMWVAEGFLRNVNGQSPEDVAERCVEDLFDRSLILMSEKNSQGKIKTFRIHDLLLDFCLKEAMNEKFLQIRTSGASPFPPGLSSDRRISIHITRKLNWSLIPFAYLSCTPYIRSLICVGRCSVNSHVFSEFKLLRVLDATQVKFPKFPPQLLKLLNLRYIALMCEGDIPASIKKLWNLHTLIVVRTKHPKRKDYLPVEICNMTHLRHVSCDGAHLPHPTAVESGFYRKELVLEGLHTLSGLWNLVFTKEMLQRVQNIKKIDVGYEFSSSKDWSDYQLENLGKLHQLNALKIRWTADSNHFPSLQRLIVRWCHNLVEIPSEIGESATLSMIQLEGCKDSVLRSAKEILEKQQSYGNDDGFQVICHKRSIWRYVRKQVVAEEHACVGEKWEPYEEEFRELKILVLEELGLKHWKADSNHFPSLECLIIRWCNRLIEIPSGMGESLTLTTIELYKCNASVVALQQMKYGRSN
ncbi:putative late blight resistance protein homolog R1A-10 [Henckelia pumila]|uniref:putative late blight resistance protein homolog R1A-10 n=1 Tax=Henckelia pumila TaxID=405737 RepID=UPI003C6DEA49